MSQKNKAKSTPILKKPSNASTDLSEVHQNLLNFRNQSFTTYQEREDQLKTPSEFSNNDGDFFDNYEEKETEEVESYCTDGSADDEELYKEENPFANPENDIKELVQVETLNEKQKEKTTYLLRQFGNLFAIRLD
ncbi:25146_t:CDS:2 [Racocetra persica]|uniref:25146_t:CDS:1 n=1 Tax=Racocetra persica TaxID=160502 RepID=A0ACA9LV16_9GLOM|nr:25146_t:CDS:2 [Racocetra persica]